MNLKNFLIYFRDLKSKLLVLLIIFTSLFVLFGCDKSNDGTFYINVKETPKVKVEILKHSGGRQLKHSEVKETVTNVLENLDNLNHINKTNLRDLVLETMIVETLVGKSKYDYSSTNYRNYGIAQIRTETAKDVLDWLQRKDPNTYTKVKSLMNSKVSLKQNLLSNVPFSIAICAEYYLRRNSNLHLDIRTLEARAQQWKKNYNTYKGLGTVQIYCQRVQDYYSKHRI